MSDNDPIQPSKTRRKNVVEIEADDKVLALALILSQTPAQFVAQATEERLIALMARLQPVVVGG